MLIFLLKAKIIFRKEERGMQVYYHQKAVIMIIAMLLLDMNQLAEAQDLTNDKKENQATEIINAQAFALFMDVSETASAAEQEAHYKELSKFTLKLQNRQRRYRFEKQFIRYVFHKVHRKYMKHYAKNTDLHELMERGRYDCITGTALYAIILDALGYQYSVGELPYHVFLMVKLNDGQDSVLLESTDAHSGFVAEHEQIKERMAMYAQDLEANKPNQYDYTFEINERIQLKELAALNYYNEAVHYYNQQRLDQASTLLRQAQALYPARRMQALQSLIDKVVSRQMAVARD